MGRQDSFWNSVGTRRQLRSQFPYELFSLALSVIAIVLLSATTFWHFSQPVGRVLRLADDALCLFFFFDFLYALASAPRRLHYLLTWGWIDLVSSLPAFAFLQYGRLARIVRVLRVLRCLRSLRIMARLVVKHRRQSLLFSALLLANLFVLLGSIGILEFETAPNSNIRSAGDAIWWTIVTMSTVGYGDLYPVTLGGRAVAVALMIAGIGLFGTIAGLVSSWFLHSDDSTDSDERRELLLAVRDIQARLDAFDAKSDASAK